jgi:hypothetical protein
MILRVFWPDNSSGLVQQLDQTNSPCLLLGAILNSTQQAQAVTSAVVISLIPLDLLGSLLEVQQQLSKTQVALSAQPGTAPPTTLAVLGVWLPQKQNQQHPLTDDATRTAEAAAANLHGLWLVLRGQQSIHHTLGGCSWRAQQTTAPNFELQQCVLPSNTQFIQVTPLNALRGSILERASLFEIPVPFQRQQQQPCASWLCGCLRLLMCARSLLWLRVCLQLMVYAVPAQQPGFAHVQLPRPSPAPQLPWMNREPGNYGGWQL